MKIVSIETYSPLLGRVKPGDELVKVNGHPVEDMIDFQFHNTEETLELKVKAGGKIKTITLDGPDCGDLGLVFEDAKIKVCNNNCIFCFVHQQPKGMRRSLYIKDDDYRYSFTHGNFVSLSGMSAGDFRRIIEQRLSPLYISVHATDDKLRRCIFKNEKLKPILPRLKKLADSGIRLHTQTVICPGINDGEQLDKTIADLAALAPGVESLAVVPVGLTRYRDRLPQLRTYTKDEAREVIRQVEAHHQEYLDRYGTRFVFPSDEFFIVAGRKLPPMSYYEEMPQFENGVGMMRQFLVDFNRRKRYLPDRISKKRHIELVTGKLAAPFLRDEILPVLNRIKNLKTTMTIVENTFWGKTVTVTGLLTGKDIVKAVAPSDAEVIVLPPNCLNTDGLFLDDMSFMDMPGRVGRPVNRGSYTMVETIKRAIDGQVI